MNPIPMTDPWCCYINGVPWIPSINTPLTVSIYASTMDPSWDSTPRHASRVSLHRPSERSDADWAAAFGEAWRCPKDGSDAGVVGLDVVGQHGSAGNPMKSG